MIDTNFLIPYHLVVSESAAPIETRVSYHWIKESRARTWHKINRFLSDTLDIDLNYRVQSLGKSLHRTGNPILSKQFKQLTLPELLLYEGYERLHGQGSGIEFLKESRIRGYTDDELHSAAMRFINLSRLHMFVFNDAGELCSNAYNYGIPEEIQTREVEGSNVLITPILNLSEYDYLGDLPNPLVQAQLAEYLLGRSLNYPTGGYRYTQLGEITERYAEDPSPLLEAKLEGLAGETILLPGVIDLNTQNNCVKLVPPCGAQYLPSIDMLTDRYTVFTQRNNIIG